MSSLVTEALAQLKSGRLVLLLDEAPAARRYYLVGAAELVTADIISFIVNHARGVVCAAISEKRTKELGLPSMSPRRQTPAIDFAVSVEARSGVTTGISAADRANTLKTLAITKEPRIDLVTPGHIFPLRAKDGGVLVRSDIAEAAVDLMIMAGLSPVAVFSHCLSESGSFMEAPEAEELCKSFKIPVVGMTDLIRRRLASETIIEQIAEAKLPTEYAGEFDAYCYRSKIDQAEHLALVKGDLSETGVDSLQKPVLVRVQSEHRLGDLLGLQANFGLTRIREALAAIERRGRGVFVYVRHPRKGILAEQAQLFASDGKAAPAAQQLREYGIGAQMLRALNVKRIELLTNSATDIGGIEAFNLEIVGRVGFDSSAPQPENRR